MKKNPIYFLDLLTDSILQLISFSRLFKISLNPFQTILSAFVWFRLVHFQIFIGTLSNYFHIFHTFPYGAMWAFASAASLLIIMYALALIREYRFFSVQRRNNCFQKGPNHIDSSHLQLKRLQRKVEKNLQVQALTTQKDETETQRSGCWTFYWGLYLGRIRAHVSECWVVDTWNGAFSVVPSILTSQECS